MKLHKLWPLLAACALAACQSRPAANPPTPTPALATISALLPTTLAAYRLPDAASPTPIPSSTFSAYPAPASAVGFTTVTPVPFTPLPPAPIIGWHTVQAGETIFCIGRGYGVLPAAIAQANALSADLSVAAGRVLQIPAVQWTDIPAGPVCAPQFQSPFPGLPVATSGPMASPAPVGAPLGVSLNWNCIANCGSKTGNYVIRVEAMVSGGVLPYTYQPAQVYDVTVPHCTTGQGTVIGASADDQTAQAAWTYVDTACP